MKSTMQRKALSVVILVVFCLLTLSACPSLQEKKGPRVLTTEEYLLLNQDHPLWLVQINLADADLRGVNLSKADLRNANLSNANLSNANLSGADLSGADLRGANLNRADLSGANLRITNLSGANMSNANVSKAEYNAYTRWRVDFDPEQAGAIKTE
jgi:uncharacterized protein YjbI with pentapeptide repeats